MEIENALYESKYIEGFWNTVNNIAQNGVGAGIKKTVKDFVQNKANNENKKAADKSLNKASENFMTDQEWQTFINNVGALIQNYKKNLSPKGAQ